MKLLKKITILLCFLSLIAFVSCGKNPAEPETEGNNGNNSVPTSTGVPATDLPNGYYKGNLQCKSCIVSYSFDDSYGSLKQYYEEIFTRDSFYLKIANNKLKWTREGYEDFIEDMVKEVGALKSGSEYSVTYSFEDNDPSSSSITKTKETIRFTISGDTISITTYIFEEDSLNSTDRTLEHSFVATYEGTLTKYAETKKIN